MEQAPTPDAGFGTAPTRDRLMGMRRCWGVSVGLLVGCHCCRLAQHAEMPRDCTIGVPRGTDTIPALACCAGEKRGVCGLGWET